MSAVRKLRRVGKRAYKFEFTASYQSVVIECHSDKWTPNIVCVAWHRRGRRLMSKSWPWLCSPDNKLRGVVVWPEPEPISASITLYKGPKDKSYESKEWEFSVIDVDNNGHRKVLATDSINMVRYVSALSFEHELYLKLRPVSKKIKKVVLEVSMASKLLKEGKATDDDMISLASMMSVSNLSTIGFLEDEEDNVWGTGRSITPPQMNESVASTEQLIDWAQEVTTGYPGVKVFNMTTSWRNGLAFCAIIHHYRPDCIDFDQLSPNSIKENNRLAFVVAQGLGIACTLTPNAMLLNTIPDKLAVTSFVYQMYNYFTKATISAVSKKANLPSAIATTGEPSAAGDAASSSSQIDSVSQFNEQFTFDRMSSPVSPDIPPEKKTLSKYSRYSSSDVQTVEDVKQQQADESPKHSPKSNTGKQTDKHQAPSPSNTPGSTRKRTDEHQMSSTNQSTSSVLIGNLANRESEGVNQSPLPSSSPVLSRRGSLPNGLQIPTVDKAGIVTGGGSEQIKENAASPCLEEERKPQQAVESPQSSNESLDLSREKASPSDSPHLANSPANEAQKSALVTGGAESPPHTEQRASASLHHSKQSLPDMTSRRTLASVEGVDASSSQPVEKGQHSPAGSFKKRQTSQNSDSLPRSESPLPNDRYRQQFNDMLAKVGVKKDSLTYNAFTDKTKERLREVLQKQRSAGQLHVAATSVHGSPLPSRPGLDSAPVSIGQPSSDSQETIQPVPVQPSPPSSSSDTSTPEQINRKRASSYASPSTLDSHKHSQPVSPEPEQPLPASVSPSPPVSSRMANGTRRRTTSQSTLVIKAPSAAVSKAALEMAQKPPSPPPPEDKESTDEPTGEKDNNVDVGVKEDEVVADKERQEGLDRPETIPLAVQKTKDSYNVSNESPSAWSIHSNELKDAILVSESEYVRSELLILQKNLKVLEERGFTIERDIRVAMAEGDTPHEELLMTEHFKLLNEKNALVKRQIELSLIEKSENLEGRQFFINRELRPLSLIPDEEKTETQRLREQQLIRELLEVVDERERLDHRLTTTTTQSDSLVESFSPEPRPDSANSKPYVSLTNSIVDKVVRRNRGSGEKECVIS